MLWFTILEKRGKLNRKGKSYDSIEVKGRSLKQEWTERNLLDLLYLKDVAYMGPPLTTKQSTPEIQHGSEAGWETKSNPSPIRTTTNVTHCSWEVTQRKQSGENEFVLIKVSKIWK